MAITNEQQTQILKIVAGLFNGGISASNLTALATLVDEGTSMLNLSNLLAVSPIFTENIMGGKVTIQSQVAVMMSNFGVVADNDPRSPGSEAEKFFTDKITAGVGFGAIVDEAVNYLSADNVPVEFAAVAALLDNKALVAEVYVGTNPPDDFATMIALLTGVTATNPTTRAEAAAFIDSFVGSPTANTFTLTNAIDNLVGTSGVDIFIGDNETTSVADTLVGGDSRDVLQLFDTNITPNISGIEQAVYNAPGGDISVANFADVTSVELKNAVPGHTITTTQGQTVTLTNIDITFGNDNGLGNSIRLAGDSVTSLDLTLNKFGALGSSGELIIDGEGLSTLNITGAINASVLTIDTSQQSTGLLKTLTITGDQDVSIGGGNLTMIDASSATGRIAIQVPFSFTDLTFKGGSGDDTIRMGDTLTSGDTLTGGAGIDMLRVSNGDTINSASAVANISEFEFFNATDAGTYNLSFLNANNALIGLRISSDNTTVNNINAASVNNIQITSESSSDGITLNASDFIAGGTSDTATITLDNSRSQTGSGVNSDVDFDNLDVLNLISKSDGTPTKILNGGEQNSLRLNASDLEKIVVTGDEALFLDANHNTLQLGVIDASGLDAPVHIRTDAVPSILAKGTTYDDTFDFGSTNTIQTTLFTGGGSDQVFVTGASSTSAHTLSFTATELNAGDLKAGDATTVELSSALIGSTVTINLSSALEGLLKSGGTFLSTTSTNIDIHGTSLSNTTNLAAIKSINPAGDNRFFGHDLQFDLNGDGFFKAGDDAEISIYGDSVFDVNNTLVYDAAADALIYTVASGFVSF